MALETASGTVECPECFAEITVAEVMQSEIVQCPDCGAELEVTSLEHFRGRGPRILAEMFRGVAQRAV